MSRRNFTVTLGLFLGMLSSQVSHGSCTSQWNGHTSSYNSARLVPSGSVPSVVGSGIDSGMGQWNDCNTNGWDFPYFSSSAGEITIQVNYMDGFRNLTGPSSCAEFEGATDGSFGTIILYSQGRDTNGTPDSCIANAEVVSDRVAHELGHYLGLANSPCTDSAIMGGPGTLTSTARQILTSECSLVDSLNTNPIEDFEEDCGDARNCGAQGGGSPIILDLDGDNFHLTGVEDGVQFDIDGDMEKERVAWTRADSLDAFLCRDRNSNGIIDGANELFGDATPGVLAGTTSNQGYTPLAEFDSFTLGGNSDGYIDSRDVVYERLLLWIDANHNGSSEANELMSLSEAGIERIELHYQENRRVDQHGNELRYRSRAWIRVGKRLQQIFVTDVFFDFED